MMEAAQIGGRLVVLQRQRGESRREALLRAWYIASASPSDAPLVTDTRARMSAATLVMGCTYSLATLAPPACLSGVGPVDSADVCNGVHLVHGRGVEK